MTFLPGPFRNRRHEQRHGQSATRCLALVFSVLTMIGSGFIIGFGFQTLVEVSFTASVIGNNEIIYGPYLLITIGILSFVMTPIGFYSIILNDKKVMVTHMFATFVLGVMCAVTAVLGYDLNSHVTSKEMETWMKTSIREDYGNPSAPHILTEWNKVQQQVLCGFFQATWRSSRKIIENQTICIQASNRCLSADNSIANRDVCLQHSTDYRLSADAYRYTNGCLQPIRSTLEFFSFRIFIYSSALCVTLLLSTIVWLVVHEISSSPILPFRLIK
ncbi:Protein CBR-TSP-16 [Caenorhabditis briggsae]|uniref:Protein CBR-TSP-16 n=1 Tax=Caenorhabditis briggsae TaxID=6238 RepID=A8XBX7_CAEBR|nr:Protein CBR-TSP-16 [Caenorhabditis briggsae]CAP30215.2 Protein CBR-TSP-16 [Caenorhabditis briggsae]